MNRDIFTTKNVIVQGMTGRQGSFHTEAMLAAGTQVVAGVSKSKAGRAFRDIPVFGTVQEAAEQHQIDVSVLFVPAPFAKAALIEAIDAEIPLIVCITENIPVHDMMFVKNYLKGKSSTLIGPNSPGVLLPGKGRLGIIPDHMGMAGSVGVVSRSGTLTYEAMAGLTERGIGQKYVIGIGGDPIKGAGFRDCLQLFEDDPEVDQIVMIGEIGGTEELAAAEFIEKQVTKPVFGYVAGHTAPPGVQLGHAGAILGSDNESAAAKTAALKAAGVRTADSIVELIENVQ